GLLGGVIWAIAHADAPHRDVPARRRSASFFMTEPFGVDKLTNRAVIDLHTALRQLADKAAQGKIRCPAALHQPIMMSSRYRPRLIAADLARLEAAGLAKAIHPGDRGAIADTKMRRCLPA